MKPPRISLASPVLRGRQWPQRNTLSTPKEYPFRDITEKIISCTLEIHSLLGPGLLENLYEEAMEHELKSQEVLNILDRKNLRLNIRAILLGFID